MPSSLPLNIFLNKSVYAKKQVTAYSSINDYTIRFYIVTGGFVGQVYSWVTDSKGILYFMFYKNNLPYYIKIDDKDLQVLGLEEELKKIQAEQDQKEKDSKGLFQYYLDKYLPYIVGGVVIMIALPTITKTIRNDK